MSDIYLVEQSFDQQTIIKNPLQAGVYDECIFNNCDFQKQSISNFSFIDCVFNNCNLSNTPVTDTVFRDVKFNNCKMIGVPFYTTKTNSFIVAFDNCILDYSSFHKLKLKAFQLKNCSLQSTDFSEADMSHTVFENCNLQDAVFENTLLLKSDFTSAYNYQINPNTNKIKNAKFGLSGLPGLLSFFKIEVEMAK